MLRSRRKVLTFCVHDVGDGRLFSLCRQSDGTFYLAILFMGFGVGYWTILVTIAEHRHKYPRHRRHHRAEFRAGYRASQRLRSNF